MQAALDDEPQADAGNRSTAPHRPTGGGDALPRLEELAARFPQLEIVELLGRGGMGAVYKARQKSLNRLVALKILLPETNRDPSFAERFLREARALARLTHPHIVAVYDFGEAAPVGDDAGAPSRGDALFYILMQYVDGVNLRQMIRTKSISPSAAMALVPQICDALEFAHEEGIVHRDIKPENILVDRRGRVKIADFGLAKLLKRADDEASGSVGTLTDSNQVMGTARYMAPEQWEGSHDVDHRADIFSLGVVFYELLTGELPIGRFPPPSRKVQVDVRLDEVVLRALEKEPDRRWQHASDVKSRVDEIQTHPARSTAAAPSPTPAEPSAPPIADRASTRRRALLGLTATAAIAGAAFGLTSWNPPTVVERGATFRPQSRAFAQLSIGLRMHGPQRPGGQYVKPDVCEFTFELGGFATRGRYTVGEAGSLRWTVGGEERPFERDRFLTWLKSVARLPLEQPAARREAEELADLLTAWSAEVPGTFDGVFATARGKLRHFDPTPDLPGR